MKSVRKYLDRVKGILLLLFTLLSCTEPESVVPEDYTYPAYFGSLAWHPDGVWLAAIHSDSVSHHDSANVKSKFTGVWLINTTSSEKIPLLMNVSHPAWSSDGKWLAFVQSGNIHKVRIDSIDEGILDSNSFAQLTNSYVNTLPTWGNTDEFIYYDTDRGSTYYTIWKMNSSGIQLHNLCHNCDSLGFGDVRSPSTNGNGESIVHIRYTNDTDFPEIFTMSEMGEDVQRLTSDDDSDLYPKISNSNDKILWSSNRGGGWALWLMDIDGGNVRQISPDNGVAGAWSPDDNKISYVLHSTSIAVYGNGEIWIMDADGRNRTSLTFIG